MSQFKIFSKQGDIIDVKSVKKKDFCFMTFLRNFMEESYLDLDCIDLEKTINVINHEHSLNIKPVLYVEDDEILLEELNEYGKKSGHYFYSVTSAEEAMDVIKENPNLFKIALLDKRLPGKDGDEFGKKLKRFNKDIKAYIVTGDPESVDKTLIERGFEGVIAKPINYDIFLNLVGDSHHKELRFDDAA